MFLDFRIKPRMSHGRWKNDHGLVVQRSSGHQLEHSAEEKAGAQAVCQVGCGVMGGGEHRLPARPHYLDSRLKSASATAGNQDQSPAPDEEEPGKGSRPGRAPRRPKAKAEETHLILDIHVQINNLVKEHVVDCSILTIS